MKKKTTITVGLAKAVRDYDRMDTFLRKVAAETQHKIRTALAELDQIIVSDDDTLDYTDELRAELNRRWDKVAGVLGS